MVLKRKDNQRKEMMAESRKKNKVGHDLKERVQECLEQADSGLGSLHDQLDKPKRYRQDWKHWWNLATKQKKEVRERLEAQIRNVEELLQNSKA